jgi:hypothetical protein
MKIVSAVGEHKRSKRERRSRKTYMVKKRIAELITLQGWSLSETHMARHHFPAAARSFGCRAASRLILAFPLATVFLTAGCGNTTATPAIPTPEVEVASVVHKDVPIFSEDGYVNAQIQPQVTGYIIRQTYKEGSAVSDALVALRKTREFRMQEELRALRRSSSLFVSGTRSDESNLVAVRIENVGGLYGIC